MHYFGYQNASFLLQNSENAKRFNSANKEQILTIVNEAIIDLRNDIINIIVEVCSKLTIKTLERYQ